MRAADYVNGAMDGRRGPRVPAVGSRAQSVALASHSLQVGAGCFQILPQIRVTLDLDQPAHDGDRLFETIEGRRGLTGGEFGAAELVEHRRVQIIQSHATPIGTLIAGEPGDVGGAKR